MLDDADAVPIPEVEFVADPLAVLPPRPLLDLDVGDDAAEPREEGLVNAGLEGFRRQSEERGSAARGATCICTTRATCSSRGDRRGG